MIGLKQIINLKLFYMKTQTGSIGKAVGYSKTEGKVQPAKTYPLGVNVDEQGRTFTQTPQGRIY